MFKRICSVLVALAMVLTMTAVVATADGVTTPTIEASVTEAEGGDSVVFTIGIINYVPCTGLEMEVGYDAAVFSNTTVAYKQGRVMLFDAEPSPLVTVNANKNPVYVSFANAENMVAYDGDDETTTPTMFKVTMKVKSDAPGGNTTVTARIKDVVEGGTFSTTAVPVTVHIAGEEACSHSFGEWVGSASGHTRTCTLCGAEETVAHTAATKQENTVPATCAAAGSYDEVSYCTVCNYEISRTAKTIAKLAHTPVTVAGTPATCTATGLTAGSKCSVCGEILTAQQVIAALGHTAGEAVRENEVPATCAAAGSYDEVVYCSVCGAEMSRTAKTIAKLAHTPVTVAGTPATCTATGLTAGSKCSVCGEILTAQQVIDALGHTAAEAVRENEVPATCAAAGSYDEVVYCSVCGAEMSRTAKTIAKLAHTPVEIPGTPATCTATGLTAGSKCSVCGEILTAQQVIAALGHTAAEAVRENEVPATCTAAGSYDEVVYCSVCGAEMSCTAKTIAKLAHTPEEIPATPATCSAPGLTAGSRCSVCGEILTAQQVIPVLDHTGAAAVRENVVPATCSATGSYDEVVYCTFCGIEMSRTAKTIAKLAHTPVEIPGTLATCTAAGLTAGSKCSVCNEILAAQEVIPALGHTAAEAVRENEIPATCTAAGSYDEVVYCAYCGIEMSRTAKGIDQLAHVPEEIPAVPATCTESGLTAGSKCALCGEILVAPEVEAARGHVHVEIPAVEPGSRTPGWTAGEKCAVCGEIFVAPEEIPPVAMWGDVNDSKNITLEDAIDMLKYLAYLYTDEDINVISADVTLDGEITLDDAIYLLQYLDDMVPALA